MTIVISLIRSVIFDMDGTLLDSEGLSSVATDYGFRQVLGRDLTPEENAQLVGRPVKKVLSQWFPDQGEKIYSTGRKYFESNIESIQPYRGIPDLLARLHGRYTLAVVTSSHRTDAEKLLGHAGILQYFSFYIGQEDTNYQKPDPEPVLLALKMLGTPPAESIFVGDQPYDIIAAHEAGMKAIGAVWGTGKADDLYLYSPDFIAHNPDDVLRIINSL